MKLKKILSLAIACMFILGCAVLVGCGGKNDDPDTITVGVANNTSEMNIINTFRQTYLKANPGKKIEIIRLTGSYDNALAKLNNSKDLPDIIQVYDFSAEYWTDKGVFYPVSDYMTRDGLKESDYFDAVVNIAKSGTDFDAAGVDYPTDDWTWAEFEATCRALAAKTSDILALTGQQIFYPVDMNLNWEAVYYPAIRSFGGDLFDRSAGTAIYNESGVLNGMNTLLALADRELAVSPSETGASFPAKQSAMHFTTRPNIVSFANSLTDLGGNATIDFVSMPSFGGVETSYIGMGCTGYAISSQCSEEKREAAWDFLKFIMTEEGQNAFCASGAGVPVLKAMAADENAVFRQYLPNANHDAFVQFSERDLPMNYMHGLDPNTHLAVRQVLVDELSKNFFAAANRTNYLAELKAKLENALR